MKLIVDSNDYVMCKGLAKRLSEKEVEFEVRNLNIGDFMWETDPPIIFERKTIKDFMQGLFNHHVHTQLIDMQKVTPYNYIIIVGNLKEFLFNPDVKRRYNIKQYMGGICSLSVHGARFLFCENNSQMVYFMVKMLEKFEKKDRSIILEQDMTYKSKSIGPYTKILMLIPMISSEKSFVIESKYPTFRELKEALNKGPLEVDGVGKVIEENIRNFIKEIDG
jgi:ERCC4-type nuclease